MAIFSNIILWFCSFKESFDRSFIKKRPTEDAEYVKSTSIKPEIVLNNGNKAIGCNCRVNLDSNRIFCYTPEGLYIQMLLYPPKKQFHLPPVFIKQGNVFCADFKIISEVSEGSLMFDRVIADTPEQNRIFPSCLLPRKPYRLIVKNIVWGFKEALAINDFIFKLAPLPYYKVGSDEIDCKEPCKIKIPTVKNVISIRFVRNFIHGIHVINFGLCDMEKGWDLSHNIIEGMHLDAAFCLAEACPPEEVQAQVNGSGVESIEPASNFKFFGNTFPLGDRYHLVCKFLKNFAVPVRVCLGKVAACYHRFTKSKMVAFRGMCRYYADELPKAFAAGQLPKHHNQKLVPATERLDVFIPLVFHNYSLKCFLWKEFDELCKNIFPRAHNLIEAFAFKSIDSNRGHALLNISCINSSYYGNKF